MATRVWACRQVRPADLFCSKSSTLTVLGVVLFCCRGGTLRRHRYMFTCMTFDQRDIEPRKRGSGMSGVQKAADLALSGSNQARKGRLVDALAARGDEGRDTLR